MFMAKITREYEKCSVKTLAGCFNEFRAERQADRLYYRSYRERGKVIYYEIYVLKRKSDQHTSGYKLERFYAHVYEKAKAWYIHYRYSTRNGETIERDVELDRIPKEWVPVGRQIYVGRPMDRESTYYSVFQ